MTQAVLRFMREQRSGRIINIGSVVGFVPAPYQGIYCATKHALEGYSESLDHEVRQFGVRVSVIEPGFTGTTIAQNSQVAARALEAYADGLTRVLKATPENIAKGGTPLGVAEVVLKALTSQSPRPRYPVGREAKLVSRLRKFAPSSLFDRGLRKQCPLDPARPQASPVPLENSFQKNGPPPAAHEWTCLNGLTDLAPARTDSRSMRA